MSDRDDIFKAVKIGSAQAIRNTIEKVSASGRCVDVSDVVAEAIVAARDKPGDAVSATLSGHFWHVADGTKTILTFTIDEPEAFFGAHAGSKFAITREPDE